MDGKSISGDPPPPTIDLFPGRNGGAVCEIEEEETEFLREKPETGTGFRASGSNSFDFHGSSGDDAVYVAVGRLQTEKTNMNALIWTLNNMVTPSSTIVFLIHILPETKFIPTPLGKMHVSQVNAEQKANHETQQRTETNKFLEKFIALCSSKQVKVETVAVVSDDEGKAISELIDILKIRKLVLGVTQDDLRKMERRKGGNLVADEVVKSAADFCEVKIVCEGKEVTELAFESRKPEKTESSPESLTAEGKRKFGCFALFR